jgi:hypothetical protein
MDTFHHNVMAGMVKWLETHDTIYVNEPLTPQVNFKTWILVLTLSMVSKLFPLYIYDHDHVYIYTLIFRMVW